MFMCESYYGLCIAHLWVCLCLVQVRKGTGFVSLSELPSDGSEEEAQMADQLDSFVCVCVHVHVPFSEKLPIWRLTGRTWTSVSIVCFIAIASYLYSCSTSQSSGGQRSDLQRSCEGPWWCTCSCLLSSYSSFCWEITGNHWELTCGLSLRLVATDC